MTASVSLGEVQPHEHVGHDVARSTEAKARTYGSIRRAMLKNFGEGREISVNRVSEAERLGKLADLVSIIRQRRTPENQKFQGWAMLSVREVADKEFEVQPDPAPAIGQMPENPYHALVFLPEIALRDISERKQHIRYLAELATRNWKPCPEVDT